jgi:hypothetical protein
VLMPNSTAVVGTTLFIVRFIGLLGGGRLVTVAATALLLLREVPLCTERFEIWQKIGHLGRLMFVRPRCTPP